MCNFGIKTGRKYVIRKKKKNWKKIEPSALKNEGPTAKEFDINFQR